MPVVLIVALLVFLQVTCIGANFSTLHFFSADLGGTGLGVGLLWMALTAPRALLGPLWGAFSDRVGRRPVLLIGTFGSVLGSLLWASADAYWILLASRLVDSALAAQSIIAYSVIGDTTTPEKRSAGMGAIGGAALLGFTLGPVLGAYVSEAASFQALGLVMAGLQLCSLIPLALLPETRPKHAEGSAPGSPLFDRRTWARIAGNPLLQGTLAISLLLHAGAMHINLALPKAAESWYGWDKTAVGGAFAVLGVTGGLVQGGLVRRLAPRFGDWKLVIAGSLILIGGFAAAAFQLPVPGFFVALMLVAAGGGLAMPCLTALISKAAGNDQGLVLGLNQTAQGLGRGLAPLLAGALMGAGTAYPFLSAAVFGAGGFALAMYSMRRNR